MTRCRSTCRARRVSVKTKKKKTIIMLRMAVGRRKHHHDERRGLGNGSRPSALTLPRNAISTRERRFQIVDLAGEPSESSMEGLRSLRRHAFVLESAISGPSAPVYWRLLWRLFPLHQGWRSWSMGGGCCACYYLQGWRRADRGSCFPDVTRESMLFPTTEQRVRTQTTLRSRVDEPVWVGSSSARI
jgi:hypothetical protein